MPSGPGLFPTDWSDWWWAAMGNALGGVLAVLAVGLLLQLSVALARLDRKDVLEGVAQAGVAAVGSVVLLLGLQHANLVDSPPTDEVTVGVLAVVLVAVLLSAGGVMALVALVRALGVLLHPEPPERRGRDEPPAT